MPALPEPLTPRHRGGAAAQELSGFKGQPELVGEGLCSSPCFPKDVFLPLPLLRLFPISNGLPCPASSFHPSSCNSSPQPLVKCLGVWAPCRPGKPRSYSAPPLSTRRIWCLFFFYI